MVWRLIPLLLFVIGMLVFKYTMKDVLTQLKRIRKDMRGGNDMTKIISELVGKQCKMSISADLNFIEAVVLEVDEKWVKVSKIQKKGKNTIQIFRIEDIEEIELLEE